MESRILNEEVQCSKRGLIRPSSTPVFREETDIEGEKSRGGEQEVMVNRQQNFTYTVIGASGIAIDPNTD